jgi:hypothetical protein
MTVLDVTGAWSNAGFVDAESVEKHRKFSF